MVVGELGPGAVGTRAGSAEDGAPHLPQHDRHGDLDQSRGPGLGFREDGGSEETDRDRKNSSRLPRRRYRDLGDTVGKGVDLVWELWEHDT